jgi:hypothetical protein
LSKDKSLSELGDPEYWLINVQNATGPGDSMRKLLVGISGLLGFLFLTVAAWGTCHVVTPSGSGNKSGSDWNNACNGLTGSCSPSSGMIRGDSYYLAAGTYAPHDFSKANSGTSTITIKAVTANDHCTDTGYNAGTMFGQAKITGQTGLITDYWIVDGQYGAGRTKGSYGIFVDLTGQTGINGGFYGSTGATGTTIRYVEIKGTNNTNVCDSLIWNDGWKASSRPHDFTMSHIYGYGGNSLTKQNTMQNVTLEYSIVDQNYEDAVNCHGEPIATNDTTNFIIRYNQFINCVGTGCIATPCGTCNPGTAEIYGNVFATDQTAGILSDGVIVALSGGGWTSIKVYNNTVANWQLSQLRITPLNFLYNSGGSFGGLDLENNLFYNNADVVVGAGGGTCLSNSFYSNNRVSAACTGDQTGGAGNPFVNKNSDWHLVADTNLWSSLGSPYNTDPDGGLRTSSRGAFQFGDGSQAPDPPTGLSASVQ